MYKIIASGTRADIETAWEGLAWADPSPADAVDAREESRYLWRLEAYATDETAAKACLALIQTSAQTLTPHYEPLIERDWVRLSLEGLPPISTRKFLITGAHGLPGHSGGKKPILIEAGPAFGTGHHGTTLGCLMALEELARTRRFNNVLDLGTGSGVLSLAALKLGARHAMGTDIDGDSILTARENAAKNKLGLRFKALTAKGGKVRRVQSQAPYDLVFANILARPLTRLAPEIETLSAPGAAIILSGLLQTQQAGIRAVYQGHGFIWRKHIRQNGWSTLIFHKPTSR